MLIRSTALIVLAEGWRWLVPHRGYPRVPGTPWIRSQSSTTERSYPNQLESPMRHVPLSILAAVIASLGAVGELPAQTTGFSDYCVFSYSGENRSRKIGASSSITAECGGDGHTAPFGNWGATSNYGHVADADQFPGWKRGTASGSGDEIWQWNSCTGPSGSAFGRGNIKYYNGSSGGPDSPYDYQYSTKGTATHGTRLYRKPLPCGGSWAEPQPNATGCSAALNSWTESDNFMSLYELDWNGNSLVTTLYFPRTTVALSCHYYGCSERTSGWQKVQRKTNYASDVDAELRTKVLAGYESGCGWD